MTRSAVKSLYLPWPFAAASWVTFSGTGYRKFTAATPETGFGEPKEYPKATQPLTPVRFIPVTGHKTIKSQVDPFTSPSKSIKIPNPTGKPHKPNPSCKA